MVPVGEVTGEGKPAFPMVGLYESLMLADEARLARAREIAADPSGLADAFEHTRQAMSTYRNEQTFYDDRTERTPNPGELRATKDVALRLGNHGARIPVSGAELIGLPPGALDYVYLDRELVATRTTKAHRQPDLVLPERRLRLDLLLASADGLPAVGEIKVKRDRDLFYGLVQALACISLLATADQIARIRRHHDPDRLFLRDEPAPRFDAVLLSVARTGGDTYLNQLDKLARSFATDLMRQPALTSVVRRVVTVGVSLLPDETLAVDAAWVEAADDATAPS